MEESSCPNDDPRRGSTWPSRALARLRSADLVVVLTGAGMSAESGIPTFRDALRGHWSRFRPEDLATPLKRSGTRRLINDDWLLTQTKRPPPSPRCCGR